MNIEYVLVYGLLWLGGYLVGYGIGNRNGIKRSEHKWMKNFMNDDNS